MINIHRLIPVAFTIFLNIGLATSVAASDLNNLSTLSQSEFLALSKDLAAATSTKANEPAAPLGITGFDISGTASVTQTQADSAWAKATGSGINQLVQTKLSVTKGLPLGIDVGAFTSKVASSNIAATGFYAKYSLINGNMIMPAVALRASQSHMAGVSQMNLTNTGYDLLISKGFLGMTPYAGIGIVKSNANPNGIVSLTGESFTQQKTFVGASWNVLLLNLSAEYDHIGSASTFALKAGLRF